MKNNFFILSAVILTVFVIGSCKPKNVEAVIEEKVFIVQTSDVERGPIADYINLGGDVTTETNIDVYPEVQYGKVTQINVIIGKFVRKGDVLVVVDPSKPGYSYASNPVKAPISGYVTALFAQLGAVVNSQVPVVRIGVLDNPKDIYVKTFVPEKYVSVIEKGFPAEINFSYSDKPFQAYVSEISPVIDPMSRTFEIWLRFKQFSDNIRVGSYPDVKLYFEMKDDVVRVSVDAVLNRGGQDVVFLFDAENIEVEIDEEDQESDSNKKNNFFGRLFGKKKDKQNEDSLKDLSESEIDGKEEKSGKRTKIIEQGRARIVPVETGIRIDGYYEIRSGLSGGERMITKGHTLLIANSLTRDLKSLQKEEE